MRFAFVPVALLALSHSLLPGVHGAPSVVSDHANSLAVRQGSLVGGIVGDATDLVAGLIQALQQLLQGLEGSPQAVKLPRADSTSTTSDISSASTIQASASVVTSSVSSSTLQASSTLAVQHRQLPFSVVPGSLSASPTFALSAVLSSILGSKTSEPAASEPTTSN